MATATPHEASVVMEWFTGHFREAATVSRLAARAAAQLDGALTTGQAASRDVHVGACLKYEIQEGLLHELRAFYVLGLGPEWTDRSPELAGVATALGEAIDFVTANQRELERSSYSDARLVEQAKRHLDGAAAALIAVVDACTARLVGGDRA